MTVPTKTRRHDLDWLRVLAFFVLIFFHAGMPFINSSWHVKNDQTSNELSLFWSFLHDWRLPLLFMISGCGVWFAFLSRSAGAFSRERLTRLLLPLTFGTLLIIPPQLYYERLFSGVFQGSYLEFYPKFFEGVYPAGNFSPHHLWFVLYLLVYCFAALPIFIAIKSKTGGKLWHKASSVLDRDGGLFLIPWVLIAGSLLLKPLGRAHWFTYSELFMQFSFFVLGFLISSRKTIWQAIERQRHASLIVGVLGLAAMVFIRWTPYCYYRGWTYIIPQTIGLIAFLFAVFGYARRHLQFKNKFLTYTNEAVYPFYILHQTITVVLAFYVVQWPMNMWVKFAIVTAGTIVGTWVIYHFIIRPFNVLRPFFGMKAKPALKATATAAVTTSPGSMVPITLES